MMKTSSFSTSFWNNEVCGTNGFDTLCQRMKDGRQTCKDLEEFLKGRAKLEEEYSKGLQKLVKNAGFCGPSESSTLRAAWECLKYQTDRTAQEHAECSQAINEAVTRLAEFNEKQKAKRKQEEENTRKNIKRKVDSFGKMMQAKKAYYGKCKELEQIDLHLNTIRMASQTTIGNKEMEKLNNKQSKTKQDVEKSDLQYHTNVEALEQARMAWEKSMTQTCDEFQHLEEERIDFLRNEMWVYVNILSQTNVDDDQHNEDVRKCLEKCDVDGDIQEFITTRASREEKPEAVLYMAWMGGNVGYSKFHTLSNRPQQPLPDTPSYKS